MVMGSHDHTGDAAACPAVLRVGGWPGWTLVPCSRKRKVQAEDGWGGRAGGIEAGGKEEAMSDQDREPG